VRHRARVGSDVVVPGTPSGQTCVQLSESATSPLTTFIKSVSVSPSKKASNEEARKVLACGGARPNEPSDETKRVKIEG
ncbi:MAG: hypothetical protein EBS13_09105, partial [Verrucomicrobia bacterium]|nr:hypothetical protein [Verrucomicrobiota bacterium]